MADNHTKEQRSANMARIRSSGTSLEEQLYGIVRAALGHRWRIDRNVVTVPGNPDILVPSLRLAIFADGCFFHGCPMHYRPPQSNQDYWVPKISGNIERDARNRRALEAKGWRVWRIWEHELTSKSLADTTADLAANLNQIIANHHRKPRRTGVRASHTDPQLND